MLQLNLRQAKGQLEIIKWLKDPLCDFFTKENAPMHFPGVSFLLGALFMVLSVIIAWQVLSKEKKTVAAGVS